MSDPFDTLGIAPAFDLDLKQVERQVRELSRVLHPDRHVASTAKERRMALGKAIEVNEAWRILRDPVRRAEALLRRAGVVIAEGAEPKSSPAFLMDVMERREALADARRERDEAALNRLVDEVRALEKATTSKLSEGLGSLEGGAQKAEELVPLLGELRYYRRFFEEVSAIEDDFAMAKAAAASSD